MIEDIEFREYIMNKYGDFEIELKEHIREEVPKRVLTI